MEYRMATINDVQGIIKVCSDGYHVTYKDILPEKYITQIINEFYNEQRVSKEITNIDQYWNGWFVAEDNGQIVGAGGGGFREPHISELYVLYLDPTRKREGIGSCLLNIITDDQIRRGAREQWVSVSKGNHTGIPFYEAKGFKYQYEKPMYTLPENENYISLKYKRQL
ncbi:GNAT family N-acetyltransferase [Mammaliicoccus sciuri]|nr:GNAT family N-acetyltransferase [Mammaliicoccus sciuri]MCE5058809.1 GNAT family N-acetyltransferase [Mammaliicoccus sciuri]PTJ44526.1 GNAT family N-acetyltransferase [Mammaliicoccus sciuri]RIN90311.1 GNAT family N-acetyltransferase [Mammaliicoccus sciuri]RIN94030.1 GNAT family N-acetyltransferase [Mammaliicoccus sciuri]